MSWLRRYRCICGQVMKDNGHARSVGLRCSSTSPAVHVESMHGYSGGGWRPHKAGLLGDSPGLTSAEHTQVILFVRRMYEYLLLVLLDMYGPRASTCV